MVICVLGREGKVECAFHGGATIKTTAELATELSPCVWLITHYFKFYFYVFVISRYV